MKIALAQMNPRVGGMDANTEHVLAYCERARDELGCDLVLFPELVLSGYPPEDLLLHHGLRTRAEAAFEAIRTGVAGIAVYLGHPEYRGDAVYNAASLLVDGQVLATHRKRVLPNYGVFDEKRYFQPGTAATVAELCGHRVGLIICEDAWDPDPIRETVAAGAEMLLICNGSPYDIDRPVVREQVLAERARENNVPVVYVNMVGGQDELVFDGGSLALDGTGRVVARAPLFEETLQVVDLDFKSDAAPAVSGAMAKVPERQESVYRALVLGTRDYVEKNGFNGVVLGLSGGIDSALTLCIAVDALGPGRVHAVLMPSQFTASMSVEDARQQADALGVHCDCLPIEPLFDTAVAALAPVFGDRLPDSTEENIQARCRGLLLMAVSNKLGEMLLTTGNKSEMAVGYATLYGDMAGGFAPLKDCSKTLVYALSHYRNSVSSVIPERVLTRAPSAELRADQKDTDSLPAYDVLDPILAAFIEKDYSVEQIAALGFDRETVVEILKKVKRAEYKRRQAPPGVRVSSRAFGRDWRYPITSDY